MFNKYNPNPIGHIQTPFAQKFGIPRQPAVASRAIGHISFTANIDVTTACKGLNEFSHLWLIFLFDQHLESVPSMTVRPPRLGGTERIGVFASRSSYRPNHIGLSVVKNHGLEKDRLIVSGVDMLSGTPILDIKPYIKYTDCVFDAECGYAESPPSMSISVNILPPVKKQLDAMSIDSALVKQVLSQDPRPAFSQKIPDNKIYKTQLYNADLSWRFDAAGQIIVFEIAQM